MKDTQLANHLLFVYTISQSSSFVYTISQSSSFVYTISQLSSVCLHNQPIIFSLSTQSVNHLLFVYTISQSSSVCLHNQSIIFCLYTQSVNHLLFVYTISQSSSLCLHNQSIIFSLSTQSVNQLLFVYTISQSSSLCLHNQPIIFVCLHNQSIIIVCLHNQPIIVSLSTQSAKHLLCVYTISQPSSVWPVQVVEVYQFIYHLPGCREYADEFRSQEIDGQALLLLKEDHLMQAMNIKLGPALKICSKINSLRAENAAA